MEGGRFLVETGEATGCRGQTPRPTRDAPDSDERTLTDNTHIWPSYIVFIDRSGETGENNKSGQDELVGLGDELGE